MSDAVAGQAGLPRTCLAVAYMHHAKQLPHRMGGTTGLMSPRVPRRRASSIAGKLEKPRQLLRIIPSKPMPCSTSGSTASTAMRWYTNPTQYAGSSSRDSRESPSLLRPLHEFCSIVPWSRRIQQSLSQGHPNPLRLGIPTALWTVQLYSTVIRPAERGVECNPLLEFLMLGIPIRFGIQRRNRGP